MCRVRLAHFDDRAPILCMNQMYVVFDERELNEDILAARATTLLYLECPLARATRDTELETP